MPTQVQIDGIGTIELDDSFKSKAPGEQDSIIQSIASQHAPQQAAPPVASQADAYPPGDSRNLPATITVRPPARPPVTRQPTMLDKVIASPFGRLVHDAVVAPVTNALVQTANLVPAATTAIMNPTSLFNGGDSANPQMANAITSAADQPYQDALAANRNTPGYKAARASLTNLPPAKFSDQFTAPFNSAIAGTVGLADGEDASNAAADAQTDAQQKYSAVHPFLSAAGSMMGGFALGPETAAARTPLYAGDNAAISNLAHGPVMGPLPRNPSTAPLPVPPLNLPRLTPQVAQKAADYVSGLARSAGKTPADIASAAAAANGKPMMGAEAIGPPGAVGLAALGRREGLTGNALQGTLDDRAASMPDRVLGDYASASGVDPAAASGDIQSVVANGRASAKPMFNAALSNPAPVWNPDLARLAQRPVIRKAMALAADDLRNADRNPVTLGLDPSADATGMTDGNSAGVGTSLQPTAEAWDLVKKNLNGMVERDAFGKLIPDSQSRGNYNIGVANKDLTSALRDAVPGYGAALDKSGDYLSLNKAFGTGQDFILNPNVTAAQLRDHVTGLTDAEAQAFKGGVANKLFNQAQNGSLSLKVFNRPIVQQKLTAVLGPKNAATFLSNVKTEAQLVQSGARMRPGNGSPTAEINAAMASQDGVNPGMGLALDAGQNVINHGFVRGALKTAAPFVTNPIANARAGMMPVPVRDASGALLMLPGKDLAAYLAKVQRPPTNLFRPVASLPQKPVSPYGLFGAGLATANGGGPSNR